MPGDTHGPRSPTPASGESSAVDLVEGDYLGRRAVRSFGAAIALGAASPGAAWAYAGHPRRGLAVNALLVTGWAFAVVVWSLRPFHLVPAAAVFATAWLLIAAMTVIDAARAARGAELRLSAWQNPLVYAAISVFTFVAPLAAIATTTSRHVATMVRVTDDAMLPTLVAGDVVLVKRLGPGDAALDNGEIVALRRGDGRVVLRRVLSPSQETVTVAPDIVFVDSQPLMRRPATREELTRALHLGGPLPADTAMFVEENGPRLYPVLADPIADASEPQTVAPRDGELVVAADHRLREPAVEAVHASAIVGRAVVIAASDAGEATDGTADRVGLAVQPKALPGR